MQPTLEAEAFAGRIQALRPGDRVALDDALQPSLAEEEDLRKLFATNRQNSRLSNPYVGLIDVFAAPIAIKTTKNRVCQSPEELSAKYVMPVSDTQRRKEGDPCMVTDLKEYKKNWASFTEGSLSQLLDWNNVVAAGGAVLACLTPLDAAHKVSKRAIRKHYHSDAYPTSDVDLFLWGLDAIQAERKIQSIYEAVRDAVPWDVTCIRTKHTISIHSQYPYRSIQIVLRLYLSPAEILAGFDIDAPCCAYDGQRVWANPRAIVAMMRQCNTVDMSRRSPSYEVRLAKYATRGYEVYVPSLKRDEVDPTIFERSIARMTGLARLLVLEKLTDTDTRYAFLESRRTLRGRPNPLGRYNKNNRKLKGDLKADNIIGGLEMNDYDIVSLHIPYGPGWDARRIDKLVYQTDLGMNSTFNPKNKGRRVHRHPAFFGNMSECLEDCCETCPEPIDEDERQLQEKEDAQYIRGRIKFMDENPGRQSISGSFNPIDDGEWSDQVYLKPTQQLFSAIAAQDRATVQKLIAEGIDLNQRDHVGRTCLHVAILTKCTEIAIDLIEAGARITARLVDGKTPLHLAAQLDQLDVVTKLFSRNAVNVAEEQVKNPKSEHVEVDPSAKDKAKEPDHPSSQDDWSSHSDEDVEMVDVAEGNESGEDDEDEEDDGDQDEDGNEDEANFEGEDDDDDGDDDESNKPPEDTPSPPPSGDIPDDEDQPDVIEINLFDWDFGFTALSYAVLFATIPVIEKLLTEGADVKLPSKHNSYSGSIPLHPLTLTILREDEDEACKVAECLVAAGATSTTANENMFTILHAIVSSNKAKLLATILECDEHAASVLDFPSVSWRDFVFPVVTAVSKQNYAALAVMLSYDVKLELDEADITRAQDAMPSDKRLHDGDVENYIQLAYQPVEVALFDSNDIIQLLLTFGAPISVGLKRAFNSYTDSSERRTLLDWVRFALNSLDRNIKKAEASDSSMEVDSNVGNSEWKKFIRKFKKSRPDDALSTEQKKDEARDKEWQLKCLKTVKEYLREVLRLLQARGAKSWKAVYPEVESTADPKADTSRNYEELEMKIGDSTYAFLSTSNQRYPVPSHLVKAYDELYEACYAGDDGKVQKLCLPAEVDKGKERALNISVRLIDDSVPYGDLGYTPLFAAVVGGKWTTARLILAIAAAQYRPESRKDKKFKVSDIKLDKDDQDDQADEELSDCDSDLTVEGQEVNFVDIAARPSSVQSSIKPSDLVEVTFRYGKHKDNVRYHSLISKAVIDDDMNSFTRLANLYQSLSLPLEKSGSDNILLAILEEDQPEMLDLYIKRTGFGIDMEHAQKHEDNSVNRAVNDKNKIYLGLNVHGKKRADLATRNDPDAKSTEGSRHQPLVWRAAQLSAKKIIKYLASEKPLTAYQHYASTHTDERAIWLTRTSDLVKELPLWLGWTTTTLGESPLTAAIVGKENSVEMLQLLFEIVPQLAALALRQSIKLVGYNLLTLAVRRASNPSVIDFLLAKSLSPAENDSIKGWNIYPHLASKKEIKLFEYFLEKLPKDVNEALLVQQSMDTMCTPLHFAITSGSIPIVKMILQYSKSSMLLRDIDGSTSLHTAVRQHFPKMFRLLAAAVDNGEALRIEDSVGNTILDIAFLPELDDRVKTFARDVAPSPNELDPSAIANSSGHPYDEHAIQRLEKELPYLHEIIALLIPKERKKRRTKVIWELNTFVAMVESRTKKAKAQLEADPDYQKRVKDKKDSDNDEGDVRETLLAVREALASCSAKRQLIHVADVQRSVGSDLQAAKKSKDEEVATGARKDDGLDEEKEVNEERELEESMIGPYIELGGIKPAED